MINRKTILFILLFFIVFNSFSQWIQQNTGTSNNIEDIYFLNEDTGFIAGGNILARTYDGGNTWQHYNHSDLMSLMGICFVSPLKGFAVGIDLNTDKSLIYRTVNGGHTWTKESLNINLWLFDVFFVNESLGFIVGAEGCALKTTNGGVSWDTMHTNTNRALHSVYFTDSLNGIIAGGSTPIPSIILKTADGGTTWMSVSSPTSDLLRGMHFPSDSIGYIVGWNGAIIKTTDGGNTWTQLTPVDIYGNLDVFFVNDNLGYVVGWDTYFAGIQKTTDGGLTWVAQTTQVPSGLTAVYFITPDIGFCTGVNGTVLKTTNGGVASIDLLDAQNQLMFYPNPFLDYLTITFEEGEIIQEADIMVFDFKGSIVFSEKVSSISSTFNFSGLKKGIYYLKIKTDTHIQTAKIVKV
ncbi:MAG: YCF48-related protein [Bacteroidales bacterium]|nr:YCF48-related protein [Bacteroidales bacterium]